MRAPNLDAWERGMEVSFTIRELGQGRRTIVMAMGVLGTVTVLVAPATVLRIDEWHCIVAARQSYRHMWGGSPKIAEVTEDPFDGRGDWARSYTTTHYIATVVTPGKADKIITMRKVAINPLALMDGRPESWPALFDDVSFWKVYQTRDGTGQSLGTLLQFYCEHMLGLGPYPSPAHLPIAAFSRAGTLPYERDPCRDRDDRNRSAIAHALIQVAARHGDTENVLYVAQLCEEFRTRVSALHRADDSRIELAYTTTAQALGLRAGAYTLRLDRDNPLVQSLLRNFPGFWLDNPTLADLLTRMVGAGDLRASHFVPAGQQILASADAFRLKSKERTLLQRLAQQEAFTPEETQGVAQLLAAPRFAKHLIALIAERAELARRILAEVADGPYSATLDPHDFGQSVWHSLRTAQAMYTPALLEVP